MVASVGHDCVVAALHVLNCGCCTMPISWVGACATGMIAIEPKAVCPTIIHVESIIGYNGLHGGRGCLDNGDHNWHGCVGHFWLDVCCIGTVEPCLTGGELVQVFFVFAGEVFTKLDECLLCHRVDVLSVTCSGEDAGCF